MTIEQPTTDTTTALALREALDLATDATDTEVVERLGDLRRAAACDGCRHGYSDGIGHSSCSAYHHAWDLAERLGLATAHLDHSGWWWEIADGGGSPSAGEQQPASSEETERPPPIRISDFPPPIVEIVSRPR